MNNKLKYFTPIIILLITTSCVQKTYEREVTFSVNMQGHEAVEKVGVRGDFLPLTWDETSPMQDADGDSIYSTTIVFDTPFDYVQIKFVRDDGFFELEGQDNRKIFFNKEGTTVFTATFDKP